MIRCSCHRTLVADQVAHRWEDIQICRLQGRRWRHPGSTCRMPRGSTSGHDTSESWALQRGHDLDNITLSPLAIV